MATGMLDAATNSMSGFASWIWPRVLSLASFAEPALASEKAERHAIKWQGIANGKVAPERPLRHLFAIEPLANNRKHRAYDYHYYCVRCRWLFMVDREGSVVAMENRDRALPISEGARRVRTFAYGPCGLSREELPGDRQPCAPARVRRIHPKSH